MRKSIFPSAKEALPVIVITVLFLLLTAACIGLRAEHFLMTGLFVVLFLQEKRLVNWRWRCSLLSSSAFLTTGCGYTRIIR